MKSKFRIVEFYNGKEKDAIVLSTFISVKDLNNLIWDEFDSSLIIIDCSYYLTDPKLGYKKYKIQHIPGAIFADLDNDLSGPITNNTGRHPLPNLKIFKNWLVQHSISKANLIVTYDQLGGGIAARLWFMLVQLGYEKVSVLEGGIMEWKRNDYKLTNNVEKRVVLKSDTELILPERWEDGVYKIYSKSKVKEKITKKFNLTDSRSSERFSGKEELIDNLAGHIPTAKNLFWQSHLQENLKLKSINEIKTNFSHIVDTEDETVFYCGSGVTATFNVLIMKHLELPNPGIYIGGWSEWIKD